jgi:hypothetical protein
MAAPFVLKNTKAKTGLLARFTGNKDGALVQINNLFARATSLAAITRTQVDEACEKHGVKLEKISLEARSALYEKYASFAFRDKIVTDDELASLKRLQGLLYLNDAAVQRSYWDPILELYGNEVDELIADGRLTDENRARLRTLEKDLRIPYQQAKRVYDARAGKKVKDLAVEIIQDKKISPDEENELQEICKSLDVDLDWGDSASVYARLRENWQLEHGELVPLVADINLQRKEACFAVRDVEWHETRRVTKRIGYSGPTARLRIMKGVYWRVGNVAINRVSEDVMTHVDSGRAYLTNKRVVFMGTKGNKSIRLAKILDYEVYTNGVTIQKDAGKNPFLAFDEQPEQFAVLLGRLITEQT